MEDVTLVGSLVFTLFVVGLSLVGLVLVRRYILAEDLKIQHDVADPLSQVVGMMFAILLGFMISDAMQRFAQARAIVQQEAASLADVFRMAEGLNPDKKDHLRALCVSYCEQTINDEWPKMQTHQTSTLAWNTYRKLWKEVITVAPKDQAQSNIQQVMLSSMVSLADNHRMRVEAMHSGLPAPLWAVLVIGGVATILFTYFFSAHRFKIQLVMVSLVSLVICLNIFLLATYDDPFSGDVKLAPTAFELDLTTFKQELDANERTEEN